MIRIASSPFGRACFVALVGIAHPSAVAAQQSPPDFNSHSAPHERLTFFEGTWSMEPGGYFMSGASTPSAHEETCAWLPGGRRHMVCRSWREGPQGSPRLEALHILSYREADSTYIAHFAFPDGSNLVYHGLPQGDRWVMNLQPRPDWPANLRIRTLVSRTPEGLHFIEEFSEDGGPWTLSEDYRYRRIR